MNARYGTTAYWKRKYEREHYVISLLSDSSFDLENILGLPKVNKIRPNAPFELFYPHFSPLGCPCPGIRRKICVIDRVGH